MVIAHYAAIGGGYRHSSEALPVYATVPPFSWAGSVHGILLRSLPYWQLNLVSRFRR